jgi:very-short-patch-repair endonuclease
MSASRREAQRRAGLANIHHLDNMNARAAGLLTREGWKYVLLEKVLLESGRSFSFEFPLGRFVYDLVLHDAGVIVEFDGPEHAAGYQSRIDQAKTAYAEDAGYAVVRREVVPRTVISPDTIEGV